MISDVEAREIAYDWHGGQSSPLYSYASTWKIHDDDHRDALRSEILADIHELHTSDAYSMSDITVEDARLCDLLDYVNQTIVV